MTGKRKKWMAVLLTSVIALMLAGGYTVLRAKRAYSVVRDWRAQVRQLIDQGGTIGEAPAAKTFAASYLEAVFGSDPELLGRLKEIIAKGIAEDPTINLGEVSAMIVTYTKSPAGKVEDVAAHVLGGFEIGKRRPGFNHDGYFAAQIDRDLWNNGSTILGLLGRDMLVFADPKVSHKHDELLESVLHGDITPLVGVLTNGDLYMTAVFPDPKRIMPSQLRPHVQACIFKGRLDAESGSYETTFLTKEPKSAIYTLAIVSDLRFAAALALKSQFDGVVHKTAWGDHISTWWAYEMATTVDNASLEKQDNLVTIKTAFSRPMVNASLKSIERMGRDMSAMRLVMDEKLDPRIADKQLRSGKPSHYWSDQHEWGPDWPIPPRSTNGVSATPSVNARGSALPTVNP